MSSSDFHMIDGAVRTVQQMFTGNTYSIEYYQREFSWEKKNIDELVQDLTRSFLNDYEPQHAWTDVGSYRLYFLGPVVTYSKDGVKYLVDGQQRMTSLSILMMHVSSMCEEEQSRANLNSLVYSSQFGETKFTINVPEREQVMTAIHKSLEKAPENLDQSSQVLWDRYQDVIELFPAELAEGKILSYFVDWLLMRVVLVDIGTTDKDMALEIFESMNDRGLRLSNMDMLKSFLLSRIDTALEIEKANALWRKNVQDLTDFAKNGDSDFMKTLLRSKYAETVRDANRGAGAQDFEEIATVFHKWLRDQAASFGLTKSEDFIQFIKRDISYFASIYKRLLQAGVTLTPGLEYVYYNARNDFTLQYMVIMSAIEVGESDNIFMQKSNLIAAYIDLMITRRMAEDKNHGYSQMYRPMFLLAKELRNQGIESIRQVLIKRLEDQSESLDSLINLKLKYSNKRRIYYLLARITSWLEDEKVSRYFQKHPPGPFEVEHIWADKFERHTAEFENEYEFAEVRNKFGDLLLLPKSFNASFGALPYEKKVSHYFGQNLLAQSLSAQAYSNNPNFAGKIKDHGLQFKPYGADEFTKSAIDERQSLYLEIARYIWSPDRLVEI